MGNPNSKKHKANHAGYRDKPGRRAIDALCGMYAAIGNVEILVGTPGEGKPILGTPVNKTQPKPGTQLSLF